MQFKFKENSDKARFKTKDERKFNERSPRFSEKNTEYRENRTENRRDSRKPRFNREENHRPEQIYPTEGRKASGEGNVQIWVKGGNSAVKEKKTGPLSPRAPEKIKKNRAEEMKVYGENACITLFQQRPESIVRLWATVEGAKKLGDLMSYLAEHKKAYHVIDRAEMERVTGTEHHGDMCLLVKKSASFVLDGYLQVPKKQDCLVLLDGVNNAQNVGGIVRTCAFYGVKGIITENVDTLNSSAAARVAEGGLEFVRALETKNKQIALVQLRQAGYQIVHLTRHKQATALTKVKLAEKVVFVLSEIPASEIVYEEDTTVQLSFNNPLNSGLNVAVNAGILLNQWYQTHTL
ncbi:TrmH family RNA methyltransferase [Mannheimia sp. AT1]|uniref:TrmH family RNA methyltransferase n=1 Tax=Mannheimia cairinae TaxID=3025936 RepID=A0ABT5MM23_9PAST|nr:TrmH family RNA methyltransferase [Mannheimia cairinae]MDD0823248.1 TrmH family RNA methyltransferase [Mannheimia cairinae]MDD0825726.1 TrmH family RNA methyltransferase [Mannheimia cairinae]